MPKRLRLISHHLCPYVQRAVIVASEKAVPFQRIDIDLSNKPDWFLAISPTGKVPILEVTNEEGSSRILFESAVIAEYLDEIGDGSLLPHEPLERARHRAWVEFASGTLGDIYQLYVATDRAPFEAAERTLAHRLDQLGQEFAGRWFAGSQFGLVDAAFAPVFRYFDVFEHRAGVDLLERYPKLRAWAYTLLKRPWVIAAAPPDYSDRLVDFVAAKTSHLASLIRNKLPQAA